MACRRAFVGGLYVQGHRAREIHRLVQGDPRFEACTVKTIYKDIAYCKQMFHEIDELGSLDDAKDVYERRNRDLREVALKGKRLGKKCSCGEVIYFDDPRYLKIAADLDKDMAKVDGVYAEKVVLQVDDARDMVRRIMNAIDRHSDAHTRDAILAELVSIARDIGGD